MRKEHQNSVAAYGYCKKVMKSIGVRSEQRVVLEDPNNAEIHLCREDDCEFLNTGQTSSFRTLLKKQIQRHSH